jgi:hypothetical protein
LAIHEPYESPEHPVPINATIVHALTLLHPRVPQPDGGLMYRCLTEFPGRIPGCLVPLSTLTFELDGGRLWPQIGDWEAVVNAVVRVSRHGQCDAMPLGLPAVASVLLANGPTSKTHLIRPNGKGSEAGPEQRQKELDDLSRHVRAFVARGPFWPGDNLVDPPTRPKVMPYQPFESLGSLQL